MSGQVICPINNEPCDDGRIIGCGKGPNCLSYGLHTQCLARKYEGKTECKIDIEKCLTVKTKEKSLCEMSFKKCYSCELAIKEDPHFTTGKLKIGSYMIFCKATGNKLEITKCIKEA